MVKKIYQDIEMLENDGYYKVIVDDKIIYDGPEKEIAEISRAILSK